eukprot:scaffold19464_cov95-Skeletonema_marinoi.AAC.2
MEQLSCNGDNAQRNNNTDRQLALIICSLFHITITSTLLGILAFFCVLLRALFLLFSRDEDGVWEVSGCRLGWGNTAAGRCSMLNLKADLE